MEPFTRSMARADMRWAGLDREVAAAAEAVRRGETIAELARLMPARHVLPDVYTGTFLQRMAEGSDAHPIACPCDRCMADLPLDWQGWA